MQTYIVILNSLAYLINARSKQEAQRIARELYA